MCRLNMLWWVCVEGCKTWLVLSGPCCCVLLRNPTSTELAAGQGLAEMGLSPSRLGEALWEEGKGGCQPHLLHCPALGKASAYLEQDGVNKWICKNFMTSHGGWDVYTVNARFPPPGAEDCTCPFLLSAVLRPYTVRPLRAAESCTGDHGQGAPQAGVVSTACQPGWACLQAGAGSPHQRAPTPRASPGLAWCAPCAWVRAACLLPAQHAHSASLGELKVLARRTACAWDGKYLLGMTATWGRTWLPSSVGAAFSCWHRC